MRKGILDGLAELRFRQDFGHDVLKPCEISLKLVFFKLETLAFPFGGREPRQLFVDGKEGIDPLDGLLRQQFCHELRVDFADQSRWRDSEAFREPAELLLGDLQQVFGLIWPLVSAIFQALVEQQESRLIPEQSLDAVFVTATEQEERRLVRIQMELRYDQRREPVDGLAHVRVATGQIDMVCRELSD